MSEDVQKKCPYCGELIKAAAVKCRFCGEFLDAPAGSADPPAALRAPAPVAPTRVMPHEVFFDGNVSPIALAGAVTVTVLSIAIAVIGFILLRSPVSATLPSEMMVLPVVIGAVALLYMIYKWLEWKNQVFRVTSDRVELERGVFSRKIENLDLWRVEDLTYNQTVIERALGLGRVHVVTSDKDAPSLTVGPIRGGRDLYDRLKTAQLEADRRRGVLHVEQ